MKKPTRKTKPAAISRGMATKPAPVTEDVLAVQLLAVQREQLIATQAIETLLTKIFFRLDAPNIVPLVSTTSATEPAEPQPGD